MKLNDYDLIDRGNRPSVTSRVAIKAYFLNDGAYFDPYEIKDVTIFSRFQNFYPSSLLTSAGLLKDSTSSIAKAYFAPSDTPYLTEDKYYPTASGVYRVGPGEYVVVLDGLSGVSGFNSTWNTLVPNTASSTGAYLDVWTVKNSANSSYQTIINEFNLYDNTFVSITEPLLVKTDNKLITKKIPLGSKQDVKITTTFTIENGNISDVVKNLIGDSIVVNPMIKIEKINDDHNLPARVEVSGYADTSGVINLTSENTIILPWDTDQLRTHTQMTSGNLGNMRGVYALTLKYDVLTERIVAPLMYIQLV